MTFVISSPLRLTYVALSEMSSKQPDVFGTGIHEILVIFIFLTFHETPSSGQKFILSRTMSIDQISLKRRILFGLNNF